MSGATNKVDCKIHPIAVISSLLNNLKCLRHCQVLVFKTKLVQSFPSWVFDLSWQHAMQDTWTSNIFWTSHGKVSILAKKELAGTFTMHSGIGPKHTHEQPTENGKLYARMISWCWIITKLKNSYKKWLLQKYGTFRIFFKALWYPIRNYLINSFLLSIFNHNDGP